MRDRARWNALEKRSTLASVRGAESEEVIHSGPATPGTDAPSIGAIVIRGKM